MPRRNIALVVKMFVSLRRFPMKENVSRLLLVNTVWPRREFVSVPSGLQPNTVRRMSSSEFVGTKRLKVSVASTRLFHSVLNIRRSNQDVSRDPSRDIVLIILTDTKSVRSINLLEERSIVVRELRDQVSFKYFVFCIVFDTFGMCSSSILLIMNNEHYSL